MSDSLDSETNSGPVRRRKMKAIDKVAPPAWEQDGDSQGMGSGGETEYVIEDPSSKTGYRRKKTVRKQKHAWAEAIDKSGRFAIAGAALLVIALIAVALSGKRDREATAEPESKQLAEVEEFKQRHDIAEAEEVVRAFYAANTPVLKSKYIRSPEVVLPLMIEWYSKYPGDIFDEIEFFTEVEAVLKDSHFLALGVLHPDQTQREVFLERTAEGYKVEWETTVGYQPMSWHEFIQEKPDEPQRLRLICEKVETPPKKFGESADESYFVVLSAFGEEDRILAYCDFLSENAGKLQEYLAFKDQVGVTVDVRYAGSSGGRALFEITNVVQDGWILDYEDRS
ncbi:MAG: hypothetical protein AAGA58_07995 [Verrucomicrobiota bacterium]